MASHGPPPSGYINPKPRKGRPGKNRVAPQDVPYEPSSPPHAPRAHLFSAQQPDSPRTPENLRSPAHMDDSYVSDGYDPGPGAITFLPPGAIASTPDGYHAADGGGAAALVGNGPLAQFALLGDVVVSSGLMNPVFSPQRLNYIVVLPTNVLELCVTPSAEPPSPAGKGKRRERAIAEVNVTVNGRAPTLPVKILPVPAQTIVVEATSVKTGARLSYVLSVVRVTMEAWSGWDGGVRYPLSSDMAPSQVSMLSEPCAVHQQPDLQDLYTVEHKFVPASPTEAALEVGDQVWVVAKANEIGWWAGFTMPFSYHGQGSEPALWFPAGYVSGAMQPGYGEVGETGPYSLDTTYGDAADASLVQAHRRVEDPDCPVHGTGAGHPQPQPHGRAYGPGLGYVPESPVGKVMAARGGPLAALAASGDHSALNKKACQGALEQMTAVERERLEENLKQQCSQMKADADPVPPRIKGLYTGRGAGGAGGAGGRRLDAVSRHKQHHLPLAAFVVAVLQVLMLLIAIGDDTVHANVNPWLGAGWDTLRRLGASVPSDITGDGHEYWRLLTPLIVPVGFLRLVWDLNILHVVGARVERVHGSKAFLFVFCFGGAGGYALEAALAPQWLSTGCGPGLVALTCAMLVDMAKARERDSAAFLDMLLLLGIILVMLAFGGLPGCGVWAHLGGGFFGLLAALLRDRVAAVRACSGWECGAVTLAVAAAALCVAMFAVAVVLVERSSWEDPLWAGGKDACYDVACWCDVNERLGISRVVAHANATTTDWGPP